jgi:hypothetical protein
VIEAGFVRRDCHGAWVAHGRQHGAEPVNGARGDFATERARRDTRWVSSDDGSDDVAQSGQAGPGASSPLSVRDGVFGGSPLMILGVQ